MRDGAFKDNILILILLMVGFCLLQAWEYGAQTMGHDFYLKWEIARDMAGDGAVDVYTRKPPGVHCQAPFMYTLVRVFFSGDYARELSVYRLLCLGGSLLGIVGLARMLRYTSVTALAAVVIFLSWFEPFFSDLRVANVNQLQLGALAFFLWLQSRNRLPRKYFFGGLVFGFLVMAKPNLSFVAFMLSVSWLFNRRFRKTIEFYVGLLVAAIFAFAASSLAFGSIQCWKDWLLILPELMNMHFDVKQGNYSLSALIFEQVGTQVSTYLTAAFTAAAIGFTWAGRRRLHQVAAAMDGNSSDRDRELFEDILMVGIGSLIYILSSTLVWLHYFFLAIPMALIAFRPSDNLHPGRFAVTVRRLAAAMAIFLLADNPIKRLFEPVDSHDSAVRLSAGALVLFLLGMWELLGQRNSGSQADAPEACTRP